MEGDAPAKAAEKPTITKRKIAIIGTAPSSHALAPYKDPAWDIWCLKIWTVPRWDVFFEIHNAVEGVKRWPEKYSKWLTQEHKDDDGNMKPIFTQAKVVEWPNSCLYPLADVLSYFGDGLSGKQICNYFTNQVSYMIALAIMQHRPESNEIVEEIGLWGVDMAQHGVAGRSEYAHQRPSCEFFLGWAAGAGIKVYIPPQSDLLKCRKLYAFEQDDFHDKLKAREKELRQRLGKTEQDAAVKQREADHLRGALEDVTWAQQWDQTSKT